MALAFDNATFTAGAASANARVLIHTAAAGGVLFVVSNSNENTSLSAVVAGGVACTRLGQVGYATNYLLEVWALTAPATGALTISAIHVGNAPSLWALGAATYTGQKTDGSPFGEVVVGSSPTADSFALTVSSTSTNRVVAAFGTVNINNLTSGAATMRFSASLSTAGRLAMMDIAGATTQGITAVSTSNLFGGVGVNLIASAAGAVTGVFSATDAQDKFSAPAYVLVRGVFSATDAADKFTATAAVRVSASFAATDAPDIFSASGVVTNAKVTGVFSATDAPDIFTATGYLPIRGTLAATDAQDKFTATAQVIVQGTFAATDAQDIFSSSATTRITGTLVATDVPDKFTATAQVRVTAVFNATDAPDVLSASGYLVVTGTGNITDAADKFTATAQVIVSAIFATTDAPDLFSAPAFLAGGTITGVFSATDAPDTFSAPAYVLVNGTAAFTESPDTFTATAAIRITATLNATDSPDTFAATAATRVTGVFSATDAPDQFSATGQTIIHATFAATDAPDTFSASGTASPAYTTAIFAATDAPDLFTATGQTLIHSTFAATDAPDIFSASATVLAVSVSAVAAPSVDSSAGHGKKSNNKIPYIRAPHEFWDAREAYLKSLYPEIAVEPPPAPRQPAPPPAVKQPAPTPVFFDPALLPSAILERNRIINTAIPAATSMRQLRTAGDKLRAINQQIAEQKRLQLEAERLERHAARQRLIKRNKKLLGALYAAKGILDLYYNRRI